MSTLFFSRDICVDLSTVSQDSYVMEMQVQQEDWAKQKETVQWEKQ